MPFSPPPFSELQERIAQSDEGAVLRALRLDNPGVDGLVALLSPAARPYLPQMAARAAAITQRRFGRVIQLYAPLYLSSFCANRCAYCGFSADNTIDRRLLSLGEVEQEAAILRARGFNHLLLVSGEAPARLGVDFLEQVAILLRERFAALSIEVQPLAEREYAKLFAAGITAVAVYQETYDRVTYRKVHLGGPKADFDFRLDTPDRAAAAGMREVGLGALLGLADWQAEGLALGLHLAWLRKRHWRTAFTVSFPRIRPAHGEFAPLVEVGEADLSQLLFALRIFDPDLGLVLSTREEARFRDGMIGLGPTRYSAGSCTAPGGYSMPEAAASEQFAIGDQRDLDAVCAAIHHRGFDPVRKDWDVSFQLGGSNRRAA